MDLSRLLPHIERQSIPVGQLIENICNRATPTMLIICYSRSDFVKQLFEYTRQDSSTMEMDSQNVATTNMTEPGSDEVFVQVPSRQDNLIQPTLRLIAVTQQVKLVFCPTISTFRGYLASLPISPTSDGEAKASKIVIVNMLALHRDTTEFNFQGLSRSFSLIASINYTMLADFELRECVDDGVDATNTGSRDSPWDTEVPLLSGSIKIGDAGQGWATRKISISKFANRWFSFK